MRNSVRSMFPVLFVAPLVVLLVSGCASSPTDTVSYSGGKYKLMGDGTTTPYYWVWVPTGSSNPTPPLPPPLPPRTAAVVPTTPAPQAVVVQPTPTTVVAGNGRYQLYGDGASTPYYWAWVPSSGPVPPPPPGPPRP